MFINILTDTKSMKATLTNKCRQKIANLSKSARLSKEQVLSDAITIFHDYVYNTSNGLYLSRRPCYGIPNENSLYTMLDKYIPILDHGDFGRPEGKSLDQHP